MARAAVATIGDLVPNSEVAVVIEGTTGVGIRDTATHETSPAEIGETGITTGGVLVSLGTFSVPSRGATIKVDGNDVMVTQARVDPVGANCRIEYQDVREVSGL